ncbi:MAG: TIR domain-containing protein [Byssovorax sp.]
METLFRWIHLSDIHFGHGDAQHGWDQKMVLETLRADLAAMVKKDPAPIDAIFVTGDIAFSGNGRRATEYDDARERLASFAAEAGVSASQIFLVPGNHDVNRKVDDDPDIKKLVTDLRAATVKIDTALGKADQRRQLARRMAAYLDFAKAFAPACLDAAPKAPEERLYWSHRLVTRKGLPVRIVGLNTSLLCADEQDKGRLVLGNEQLARALFDPPIDKGKELVLVLSHHPLRAGWLADEDAAGAWIRNHAHAHLSGHVHVARTEQTRTGGGGDFVWLTAGAAHGDAEPSGVPAAHGYGLGAVVRAGGKARLHTWPRKWSPENAGFRIDHDNVPDGADHAEHDLPDIALPSLPAATIAPGEPVTIFFSYAPEDEPLVKKLQTHLTLLKRKGHIKSFGGREVDAGASWKGSVDEALRAAKIVLLLISNDYLASDYCFDTEMALAKELHEQGRARVIPVLLRPGDFHHAGDTSNNQRSESPFWFEALDALPKVRVSKGPRGEDVTWTALTQWKDLDEALAHVAEQIRLIVERMRKSGS